MYKRQTSSNFQLAALRSDRSIRAAFTLVELLVVISIIGILIALTIPATTAARDRARQARCTSNIKQTNLATMEYITRYGYFPGWKNQFQNVKTSSQKVNGSWVAALLPFFNEGALEKKWVEGVQDTACLLYLICSADARPDKIDPHLSYVVNCGNTTGTDRNAGVFLDLVPPTSGKRPTKQTLDFITSNDGLSSTIMTSENNQAYMWGPDANISWQGFVFFSSNPNTMGTSQALNWDYRGVKMSNQSGRNATTADAYARPSSYHPGGVNTSWCDSRVVKLNDDIDYEIYKMMMAPNDLGCGVSQASLSILHEMLNVQ
ncbi:MAG: DUF1559 domain-containing protein [Thermoguttaceae bacterium]|nr:DUF1559 domain-containing protein [Thermoguttaceae bacterium]